MSRRRVSPAIRCCAAAALALLLAGCGEKESGPLLVSAIGSTPRLVNPNLQPLDPPSALLVEAVAQGLVHFESAGQIDPSLAQRWIVSDDGLRYTFRLARVRWSGGARVTAAQVVARLRAAGSAASRNPLKPQLGVIDQVEAMTDDVLEISLKSPRANFLQLLAQPELAILRNGQGSGPYRMVARADGSVGLRPAAEPEEESALPEVRLRGDRAALAVARFLEGRADFVTGGTAGDLPIVRAADPSGQALRFDPVAGLFGLAFESTEGPLDEREVRQALGMALDRAAIVSTLAVPGLQPRASLVPPGLDDLPVPPLPAWADGPLDVRRALAARTIAATSDGKPLALRVAMPQGPGYRIVFAFLRRDWRRIGVEAVAVEPGAEAELRLVDSVAPATMASWYLRSFSCARSPVCDTEADALMERARHAQTAELRRELLADAGRLLEEQGAFIPLAAPVRWHLVSQRLTGFETNMFGRHPLSELIAERR